MPAPCEDDLYERHARGETMPPRLPRDLHAALDALEGDVSLSEAVGVGFCEQFLTLKRAEWDVWSLQVSEWEMGRYADAG